MKLSEQQAALANWMLDAKAEGTPEGLAPLKDLNAHDGANLYRDAILEVEIKALIITFPIVHNLVGEDYFRGAAKRYLRRTGKQAHKGNLDLIGNEFPSFLDTLKSADQTPYLPDVAHLELAIDSATGGADTPPLDQQTLEALNTDPDNVECRLCPNATLLQSQHPIDKIYDAWLDGFKQELDISTELGTTNIVVWRPEDQVKVSRLTIDEWALLHAANTTSSFLHAVENAADHHPNVDIASALSNAVPNRWLHLTTKP